MDITVVIKADPALQAFLDALVGQLTGKAPVKQMASKASTVAANTSSDAADDKPTLETLRAMVAEKKDKRDKIKALLGTHGATSVSTLAEEHFAAFYEELKKL